MLTILANNRGKLPIIVLIIIVVGVLSVAGTGVFVFAGGKSHKSKKPDPKPEVIVPLDEFVLNLADQAEPHYLKLDISLGVIPDAKGATIGSGGGEGGGSDPRLPIVRDAVIAVVSKHYYADLLTDAGKEQLKAQICKALRESSAHLDVQHVYFTNFAMQ